jgi:hypothetical protein
MFQPIATPAHSHIPLPPCGHAPAQPGAAFCAKALSNAMSAYLGGPLVVEGWPRAGRGPLVVPAARENGTVLFIQPGDTDAMRSLAMSLDRGERHLFVSGIPLPADENLLYRAVATVGRAIREWGTVQAAGDEETLALRAEIAALLSHAPPHPSQSDAGDVGDMHAPVSPIAEADAPGSPDEAGPAAPAAPQPAIWRAW